MDNVIAIEIVAVMSVQILMKKCDDNNESV